MKANNTKFEYEIRIRGHLDHHWHAWFERWMITSLENGETLLKSSEVDQSAVHAALNKIRDLNLTLVSVIRKKSNQEGW